MTSFSKPKRILLHSHLTSFVLVCFSLSLLLACGDTTPMPLENPTQVPDITATKPPQPTAATPTPVNKSSQSNQKTPTPIAFSDAIGELEAAKSKAEDTVRIIKRLYQSKCVLDKDYTDLQVNYRDARATLNAWIVQIIAALQDNKPIDKSVNKYNQSLEDATKMGNSFVEKADMVYKLTISKNCFGSNTSSQALSTQVSDNDRTTSSFGIGTSILKGFFSALFDVPFKIYDVWKKAKAEERERLMKSLESEKWKSFEEIQLS